MTFSAVPNPIISTHIYLKQMNQTEFVPLHNITLFLLLDWYGKVNGNIKSEKCCSQFNYAIEFI